MKKWRTIIISMVVLFFSCSVLTVIMHDQGFTTLFSINVLEFGYFFLSLTFFVSGFLNLIAYLNGKNKGFNLSMMIMLFATGIMNLAIGLLKVLEHFGVIR